LEHAAIVPQTSANDDADGQVREVQAATVETVDHVLIQVIQGRRPV
jgi:hypothetical protein